MSYTLYVHLLSCASVMSDGLFHWKKGLAYSVVEEDLQLYHFPNTNAGKEEPNESQGPEIGDGVSVEDGADVCTLHDTPS